MSVTINYFTMNDYLVALCAQSPAPLPGPPSPNGTHLANAVTPNVSQESPQDETDYLLQDGMEDPTTVWLLPLKDKNVEVPLCALVERKEVGYTAPTEELLLHEETYDVNVSDSNVNEQSMQAIAASEEDADLELLPDDPAPPPDNQAGGEPPEGGGAGGGGGGG